MCFALLLTPSTKSAQAAANVLALGTAPPSGQVAPTHLRGSSISLVSAVPTRSADTVCAADGAGKGKQEYACEATPIQLPASRYPS